MQGLHLCMCAPCLSCVPIGYILLHILFHIAYYKTLNIILCAMQEDLVFLVCFCLAELGFCCGTRDLQSSL